MLVISRKLGETILIGNNIQITIADIQKGKVKIAIEAPREITIFRKEILDDVKVSNKEAGFRGGQVDLDRAARQIIDAGIIKDESGER